MRYSSPFLRAHLALARVLVHHVLLVGHEHDGRQRPSALVDLQMQIKERLQLLQ